MPLPEPRDNETEDAFIGRCVSSNIVQEDYDTQEQRLAVCYSQWRNKKMKTETKRVVFSDLKLLGEEGEFQAVFATLNVVDSDGDLTLPGAFGKQDVILSQYNHGSWGSGASALPIGVGKIYEDGDKAIIHGEFNLGSEDGRKTHQTIKYLNEKGRTQEWSYALPDIDYEMREEDGQRVRVLKRIRVNEVSPVLMGSGVDTRLLTIKGTFSNEDKDELSKLSKKLGCAFVLVNETKGKRLIDDLKIVTESIEKVTARLKIVKEMRKKKDRNISEATIETAKILVDQMQTMVKELSELIAPKLDAGEVAAEFLRFQKTILKRRQKDGT